MKIADFVTPRESRRGVSGNLRHRASTERPESAASRSETPPEPRGYASVAEQYTEHGWDLIPVIGKSIPPKGATGYDGTVTDAKRTAWLSDPKKRAANSAIRHRGTIAIDVDEHDDKHGATTLARWESEFGPLPVTFTSTARHERDPQSRQHIFRVQEGTRLLTSESNIEICQHHHRYSVVWPSVHPDTGEVYRWFAPDGSQMDGPPSLEEIPWLPQAWLDGLAADNAPKREADRGTTTPRRSPTGKTLEQLLENPPKRGQGRTNDWLSRVAGHHAKTHRADKTAYVAACRADIALVDPDYEDFDKTTESVWDTEQRKPKAIALDDASLVDTVGDSFRLRWCWSGAHGWREWDGKIWASRTEPALLERVRVFMQEMYYIESAANSDAGRAGKIASLLQISRVRSVASMLKGALEVDSTAFDNRPELVNCLNGVVDLRNGEIRPHDPALLLTKITSTDYLPGATHPDWNKALQSVREEDRPWLQVRVGQALTGYRVTDELMPVLYGGGRNGKTTFLSSVQSAFGSHARAVSDRVLTARDSDHPTELTDLQGLRLAVIEELPEAVPLSVKRLKDTVGQPTITARKIAKDTVTWETTHALFLATNHKPRVNETDHGTWRRLALVKFPYVFDGKPGKDHLPGDPGLHDRMRRGDEGRAEAVLAWCVAGAMRWFQSGRVFLPLPEQIVADTEEWRGESDVVISYIAERIEFEPSHAVSTSDLIADLNAWLDAKGKATWGDQLMTERLGTHERVTVHGVEKKLVRTSASGVVVIGRDGKPLREQPVRARLWLGLSFRAGSEDTQELPW